MTFQSSNAVLQLIYMEGNIDSKFFQIAEGKKNWLVSVNIPLAQYAILRQDKLSYLMVRLATLSRLSIPRCRNWSLYPLKR